MRAFNRYVLYQAPGWVLAAVVLTALVRWLGLPAWAAAGALVLILVKDCALYPFLRRAYEPAAHGPTQLVGETAVAVETLAPAGYVRVRGELWQARALGTHPIPRGTPVVIQSVRGMILLVTPSAADSD